MSNLLLKRARRRRLRALRHLQNLRSQGARQIGRGSVYDLRGMPLFKSARAFRGANQFLIGRAANIN